jgi:hypothetical protein
MRNLLPAALAVVLLAGCPPKQNPFGYGGTLMYEFFPFDGLRTWEFISTNEELAYSLVAIMQEADPEAKEPKDGISRYTVDYTKHCRGADATCFEGEVIRTITWSSDIQEGVRIHDYEDPSSGLIEFEPPILIAPEKMERDEEAVTDTGGFTWTSTLLGTESCPVKMNVDWTDCVHFSLDDGDGDDSTNPGLVGEYWAIVGYNVVTVQLNSDMVIVDDEEVGQWQLSSHNCEPLEDCDGTW